MLDIALMERTLNIETPQKVGQEVLLKGWIRVIRSHGKLGFLDVRDRTGVIQVVVNANVSQEAFKKASELSSEDVVEIEGKVNTRPENAVNKNNPIGTVEIEATKLEIIAKAETLPFDMGGEDLNLELPTLLDYRSLTLRHPKVVAIFKVQEALMEGFRRAAHEIDSTEVFVPTISASATEGGAELFKFKYFNHEAFLVQSPQLYKQMMVGVFERVFLVSHIYRAEPSVTTRHLVESIQMDFEIGFIDKMEDVLDAMEFVYTEMIKYAQETCKAELEFLNVLPSKVYNKVPRLTLKEAQEKIFERAGIDHRGELDLMPEDEREIAKWALEEYESDLITITHFPTKKRAFYSKPDPKNPEISLSYDLLYKGLEIASGAQRIDDYSELVKTIKDRGMDPKNFEMYLQAFRYGIPPHGGFSFGLERSTMKLLDLANIREASLYPRDMERVDERLSHAHQKKSSKR